LYSPAADVRSPSQSDGAIELAGSELRESTEEGSSKHGRQHRRATAEGPSSAGDVEQLERILGHELSAKDRRAIFEREEDHAEERRWNR
jgi:hypothetical protein